MEERTLVCPKCSAFSLEVDQIEEADENVVCHYQCFNCGYCVSDEEHQGAIAQERINAIENDGELPDETQNLNLLLLAEELERARI